MLNRPSRPFRPPDRNQNPSLVKLLTFDDLRAARKRARLTIPQAARLTGYAARTLERMEAARVRPSRVLFLLYRALGDGLADPEFHGWTVRDGALWSPAGVRFEPREIEALPWLWAIRSTILTRDREKETLANVWPMVSAKLQG